MTNVLVRVGVALLFVVVETVFVVAIHTYFSKPMDRMKSWFSRHSWRMTLIVLPILFAANLVVTFLFSGVTAAGTTAETAAGDAPAAEQPAVEEQIPDIDDELRALPGDSPPTLENAAPTPEGEPIEGTPADNTLE